MKFRNEYKNRPGGGADGRMPGAVRISKSRPGDAVRRDPAYIPHPLRLGVVVPGGRWATRIRDRLSGGLRTEDEFRADVVGVEVSLCKETLPPG